MGAVAWVLPILVGLVLPLWEDGPPVGASISLVIAGLLLKALQAHAEKPGVWFPLLVTGATAFALSEGFSDGWWLPARSTSFGLWWFLVGLAVAIGLGVWAWRARSRVVAVTAAGYLAAVWHFQGSPMPAEEFGWFAYTPLAEAAPAFDFPPHPELVVVAGAVLAHTRVDRVRPWHVSAVVGLLGSLWHYGALALVVAAAVMAGYDLNARRPGAWYPLLLVGVGLVVWPVVNRVVLAPELPSAFANAPPGGPNESHAIAVATASLAGGPWVDHDELFLAFAVAVGLAVWSWRSKNPIVLLTAVVYLGLTWLRTAPVPTEQVVLAGAAVAFATTAAPRGARTAGRSAGTPDRRPEP
ncbi:MAG: hypothetical protein HOQ46_14070 [Saccharothrix sp.]|nr:hypothetical protein [Saccharothrix sp.]